MWRGFHVFILLGLSYSYYNDSHQYRQLFIIWTSHRLNKAKYIFPWFLAFLIVHMNDFDIEVSVALFAWTCHCHAYISYFILYKHHFVQAFFCFLTIITLLLSLRFIRYFDRFNMFVWPFGYFILRTPL